MLIRQRTIAFVQIAILSLVFTIVVWHREYLYDKFGPKCCSCSGQTASPPTSQGDGPYFETLGTTEKDEKDENSGAAERPARVLGKERLAEFVQAVFDPADQTFQRLECPEPSEAGLARYQTLKPPARARPGPPARASKPVSFFFALDLTQCVDLLPRLLGSIVEAIRFLGPEHCVLSIVEGVSGDGTPEVLGAIAPKLRALGAEYFLQTSSVDSKATGQHVGSERIVRLAQLRNQALQPMLDNARRYDASTTVIFLNDVAACMEDILELVYQKALLGADMTCAMDWIFVGNTPIFYDVWISRTITGRSFFKIPDTGSWDYSWDLFWEDSETRGRYQAHLPFQVFSCWNGAVAFTAKPLLEGEISFRSNVPGECFQGEPQLLCKDMWSKGYSKIAVVPSVNLEYSDARGQTIKNMKGYAGKWVGPEQDERSKIDWKPDPPDQVVCMDQGLHRSEWRPWNEPLA